MVNQKLFPALLAMRDISEKQNAEAENNFFENHVGTFLPLCANCKKIKDQNGSWLSIEEYVPDRTDTEFNHEVCPECLDKLCPTP